MRDAPNIVALRLSEAQARLKKYGLVIGEIQITKAPHTNPRDSLRIVKQQIRPDGRVDLVVVYELSSLLGKEV